MAMVFPDSPDRVFRTAWKERKEKSMKSFFFARLNVASLQTPSVSVKNKSVGSRDSLPTSSLYLSSNKMVSVLVRSTGRLGTALLHRPALVLSGPCGTSTVVFATTRQTTRLWPNRPNRQFSTMRDVKQRGMGTMESWSALIDSTLWHNGFPFILFV